MNALVAMVALAAICWVFRVLFIVFVPAERLPARFREALEHLAPAVLAALVAVTGDVAHVELLAPLGVPPEFAVLARAGHPHCGDGLLQRLLENADGEALGRWG